MNYDEIEFGRKKYRELQEEKNKLLDLKKRLEELNLDEKIIEYKTLLKLVNRNIDFDIDIKTFEDEELAAMAFDSIVYDTSDSSNIYVFIDCSIYKFDNNRAATVNIYWNLENFSIKKVILDEVKEFEKENIIIIPMVSDRIAWYKKERNQFFLDLINYPQEEVIKKYKEKKKF